MSPLGSGQLWPPDVASRVCDVCALVPLLQTDESPVCSLDRTPQACDWLLACLQVNSASVLLHQSETSSMCLIVLITPAFFLSVFLL